MKLTVNKEVWGGTLLLGTALSPFTLLGPIIGFLAAYKSYEESNPAVAVWAFLGLMADALSQVLNQERQWLDVPVERLNGAIAHQSPLAGWFGFQGQQDLGTDWLLALSADNNLAFLGDQGEGKSYALHYLAYHFVKAHQGNCRLYVHDIEDGRGHGEQFNWFGLEHGKYRFTDAHDLVYILHAVMDDADGLPTLVLIDEVNNAIDELSEEEHQELKQAFKAVRNRGKKRQVQFAIGTQDNNVEDLGLNQAAIRKLVWVIFPRMARFKSSYRNLDLDDEGKDQLKAAQGQLAAYQPKPTDHPVIVSYAGNVSLRNLPEVENLPETLVFNPSDDWLKTWLETHPNCELTAHNSIRSLVDGINEILRQEKTDGLTADTLIKRDASDYRYQSIKTYWEAKS